MLSFGGGTKIMSDAGKRNQQAAFVQSLREAAQKLAAGNPALADLKLLNQRLIEEARQQLADQKHVQPFGGALDANGDIVFAHAEGLAGTAAVNSILAKLRGLAEEGKIRAASVCTIIERPFPSAGGTPILFIQFHSEHRSGLAVTIGKPADEYQSIPGVDGPAIVGYQKKIEPMIFAV